MTVGAVADASDAAQARIFLDQLDTEIDVLSQRIESTEALADRARTDHQRRLTDQLGAEVAGLRGELFEVHRLVDALVFRFPEVIRRDPPALA
ncbi:MULTISPECIES: hypothetical protein [Rhodococcus]|uniref:Uncharacterized protein n=2 Tax=Rhodococcus opacus TaxID=37919 RepID=C1BC84_RHOOB|nr:MULTISPECIES: hypothetical protein [Rhodococcus]EID79072.1 hypothetical protein W59_15486 [Rhodococcus opacus RKJ300 = JCM 13270]KAF0966684.1 hypothetical protein MLGJGCBP_00172 [Rhodococcus sp. T7]QQZ18313.1 hypothetical protein GO592_39570 [Rhodococcus sp. 21391]UOT08251.1 hypothetical protein MPY17_38690 [Rhodococcus opacus]BAH55939.1 hypothetical protein ROP_pROB01-04400 [Rhodococcus opacus B4]